MAVTVSGKHTNVFDRRFAAAAALASSLLMLCAAALLATYLTTHADKPTWVLVGAGAKIAALLLLAGVGGMMLRGRSWAHQVLLICWLVSLADTLMLLMMTMLWGVPEWWGLYCNWSLPAVAGIVMGASGVAVALLILASAPKSRLRYASMVAVAVVAAVTAAVAVNLIAQNDYYRKDIETFGRYTLSDRLKKVLASTNDKLTFTLVYTATDKDMLPADYRPRVLELLDEIRQTTRQSDKNVEVVNVTSMAGKADLDRRLRAEQATRHGPHMKLLQDFNDRGAAMRAALTEERERWLRMGDESYMTAWGLAGGVADGLDKAVKRVEEVHAQVASQLDGAALVDCTSLTDDVRYALDDIRELLVDTSVGVNRIREIPIAVAKAKDAAGAAMAAATSSARATLKILDDVKSGPIAKPDEVLKEFATAARLTATRIRTAAELLSNVAGKDNKQLVLGSRPFSVPIRSGRFQVRQDLASVLVRLIAAPFDEAAYNAERVIKNAKTSFQEDHLRQSHVAVTHYADQLDDMVKRAAAAVQALSQVDKPTRAVFEQAGGGKLFSAIVDPASKLLDEIAKLPEIERNTLSSDLAEDNIVIVEVGDKLKIVRFADIWPVDTRSNAPAGDDTEKRIFNGDSAIGSKILGMTNKPFATVLIAYYRPDTPPQIARMMPPSKLPPEGLMTLRAALAEANFNVELWNLAEDKPELDKSLPCVLLVPPVPPNIPSAMFGGPQLPSFGKAQLDKLRKEIDSGTPAVFLAMYLPTEPMSARMPIPIRQYEHLGKYLREDWGIAVKNEYRLVKGIADTRQPGRFKIDVQAFSHLPLSTFPDHPIGKPLQAQRVLWFNVCPVIAADARSGVSIEPLLTVDAGRSDIWATKDVGQLIDKIRFEQGGFVTPDYTEGGLADLPAPMDVALAASRAGDEAAKRSGARIVVLGVGMSMADWYLDKQTIALDAKGGVSFNDPPRINADLVVNSVYWLTGHERFIAAGPTKVQPIRSIDKHIENALRIACIAVLPLLLLCGGAVVMLVRRR